MKRLLNFAHPLSDKVHKQIEEIMGEFEEIKVPCQFDISGDGESLADQVAGMEAGPHNVRLELADMYIAPALSSAASILARDHLNIGWLAARVVWLKKEGNPPEFVLGGIE